LSSTGGSITVSTTSAAKIATYNLEVVGTVTGYSVSSPVLFTVYVVNGCSVTTITSSSISSSSYDI
jgi:hypothetical protein